MSSVELKGFKGLQSLDILLDDSKKNAAKQNISNLPLEILSSGKYQPRTDITDESLLDLAASIKAQGIIQPLIVRSLGDERYEIIAGERRWRAAKIAGLADVPVIIRNVSDETALAFALIENIQREALNPVDEAISLVRLRDEFSMTHEEIAERVGRSRSAVTNLMRLLSLHQDVKDLLRTNKIEMGHARALLSLNMDMQLKLAQKIVDKGMSVRDSEKLVQNLKLPRNSPDTSGNDFNEKINSWTKLLSKQLSSRVKIKLNAKGEGRVIIQVHSPDEIDWIIDKLT
jgi:ParB family chromosome partitioning protein